MATDGDGSDRFRPRCPWSRIFRQVRSPVPVVGDFDLATKEGTTAAAWFYAACCQKYRWCSPPRRGMEITIEFALGFCSTGRRFGVSFSRES